MQASPYPVVPSNHLPRTKSDYYATTSPARGNRARALPRSTSAYHSRRWEGEQRQRGDSV